MKRTYVWTGLVVIAVLLAGCGATPEPQIVEKEVTSIVKETIRETVIVEGTPQVVEREVTAVVEVEKIITATPEPEDIPAVGGTLVVASDIGEIITLDPHLSDTSDGAIQQIGATLVTGGPEGTMVPYLAESWEISEDGLTWEFKLKENVKFHNGTPLTAEDYAWTLNRALDPETQSPAAGELLGTVISAEAVDDYTLRLNLAEPYYSLLYSLSLSFLQPLSQAAVEAGGEQYGRNPVGVGPFMFKEWATGDKLVLERNPDYDWGPDHVHAGPAYIETVEYLPIIEASTILAGLEAGEIDIAGLSQPRDVERLLESGQFSVIEELNLGLKPGVIQNISRPPYDDVRVRQAFSLAVDREAMVKVILDGAGEPQYGPISPSVFGYWPGVEYIGYGYDLDKAKSLMEEAGFIYNDDGMLEKDGEPFTLQLYGSQEWTDPRVSEILQQEFEALGVDTEIVNLEYGTWLGTAVAGDFDAGVIGYGHGDVDILSIIFHTDSIGGFNLMKVSDPELDELLDRIRTETDPEKRQAAANDAQRLIVEKAYIIPLYAGTSYVMLSNRLQGNPFIQPDYVFLNDVYLETE